MPRPSHLNPDDILRFLQVTSAPAAANDISRALHLKKSDARSLFKMLGKLKKRGAIDELPGGRYRLTGRKNAQASDRPQHRHTENPQQHQQPRREEPQKRGENQTLAPNEVRGRLVLHHDGYGFVVPDKPIPELDGDIFIPRLAIDDAMHGDRVVAKFQQRPGHSDRQRAEGRIVKILDRAHPSVVGLFRYGPRYNVVLPYDARLQHEIEIPPGEELTPALREKLIAHDPAFDPKNPSARTKRIPRMEELDGAVVNIEITRYPRAGMTPIGRVLEVLGRPGDLGVDIEIIIRKHHLPYEFPSAVLAEAEKRAQLPSATELSAREDFRHLPIVTIDGETARDFDDAVYVRKNPDNTWHLQVHIADVAHYVRNATPLDQEARLRGTSVYFPDRAVPMLPESLSNGICSLKPDEDRLVMSALIELDPYGNIASSRLTSGVIKSAARMTYTNVNKILEGDPAVIAEYSAHIEHFRKMKELALLLNARRTEHGSIDFDLPERVIEFDDQQRMTSINRSERNIANRLIEEFMLTANRVVDAYLTNRALPALHRVHEKPDARKVLEFEELARAFGYSLNVEDLHRKEITVRHGANPAAKSAGRNKGGRDSRGQRGRDGKSSGGRGAGEMKVSLAGAEVAITPQHYQRLVKKITGTPEERILSYLMLRSLKQARYAADPLGHFALGFDEYTHFTSPIRRYPDLIIHRILKWALENPDAKSSVGARHAVPAADRRHDVSGGPNREFRGDPVRESRHDSARHDAGSVRHDSPASPVRGSGGDDSARHDSPPGSVRQELHREPSHASTDPQHTPIQYFASQSIPEKIPFATEQTTEHGYHGTRTTPHGSPRPLHRNPTPRNRHRNLRSRTPRRRSRTRTNGLENRSIHGAASRRGIPRFDYQRAEIRRLRRTSRSLRGRLTASSRPRRSRRLPLHLPRIRSLHSRLTRRQHHDLRRPPRLPRQIPPQR